MFFNNIRCCFKSGFFTNDGLKNRTRVAKLLHCQFGNIKCSTGITTVFTGFLDMKLDTANSIREGVKLCFRKRSVLVY